MRTERVRFFLLCRFKKKLPRSELIVFCSRLASLLEQGIPLVDALAPFRGLLGSFVYSSLMIHIKKGVPFHRALEAFPDSFPARLVALLSIGELNGTQSALLRIYAHDEERRLNYRQKISQALVYPSILLMLSVLMGIVFLVQTVPSFSALYSQLEVPLPPATRLLLSAAHRLGSPSYAIALFGASGLLFILLRSCISTWKLHQLLWHIGLIRKEGLEKGFCLSGMLISIGIPLLNALELSTAAIGNLQGRHLWWQVYSLCQKGISLSSALEMQGISAELVRILHPFEFQGQLSAGMLSVAEYLQNGIERQLTWCLTWIEPALILLLGGIIGGMVYTFMLPIIQINNYL